MISALGGGSGPHNGGNGSSAGLHIVTSLGSGVRSPWVIGTFDHLRGTWSRHTRAWCVESMKRHGKSMKLNKRHRGLAKHSFALRHPFVLGQKLHSTRDSSSASTEIRSSSTGQTPQDPMPGPSSPEHHEQSFPIEFLESTARAVRSPMHFDFTTYFTLSTQCFRASSSRLSRRIGLHLYSFDFSARPLMLVNVNQTLLLSVILSQLLSQSR